MSWIDFTDTEGNDVLVAADAILIVEDLGDCRRVVLREALFDKTPAYKVKDSLAVIKIRLQAWNRASRERH